jgi:hypothetical protein
MNSMHHFNAIAPWLKGKTIYELYPSEFRRTIDYLKVKPWLCLFCERNMTQNDIQPQGRQTPRPTHAHCWNKVTSVINPECLICGEDLDDNQKSMQAQYPQDLHYRIHDTGKCLDYFSLCSAKVFGIDTGIIETVPQLQNVTPKQQLSPRNMMDPDNLRRLIGGFIVQPANHNTQNSGDIIDMQPVQKRQPVYVRR